MTKALLPNNYLTKAMQRSIRGLEKNGFSVRIDTDGNVTNPKP